VTPPLPGGSPRCFAPLFGGSTRPIDHLASGQAEIRQEVPGGRRGSGRRAWRKPATSRTAGEARRTRPSGLSVVRSPAPGTGRSRRGRRRPPAARRDRRPRSTTRTHGSAPHRAERPRVATRPRLASDRALGGGGRDERTWTDWCLGPSPPRRAVLVPVCCLRSPPHPVNPRRRASPDSLPARVGRYADYGAEPQAFAAHGFPR